MEAVIKAGGKQQRVKPGDVIEVELIKGTGESIEFTPLLVIDDDGATHAGKNAANATVTAKPLGDKKGDKVRVLRFRPKTGYSSRIGHRQQHTLLEIVDVKLGAKRSAAKPSEGSAAKPAGAKRSTKSTDKSTSKSTSKSAAKRTSKRTADEA